MSGGGGSREEERRKLADIINHWNANRLDLFEISDPTEVSDPTATPPPGPARSATPPPRAARKVRHRARARPHPPPVRGQPAPLAGGSGTGLSPLSVNARPPVAGKKAPILGGEGRGEPLAVPGAARAEAGCIGQGEKGNARQEPSPPAGNPGPTLWDRRLLGRKPSGSWRW